MILCAVVVIILLTGDWVGFARENVVGNLPRFP